MNLGPYGGKHIRSGQHESRAVASHNPSHEMMVATPGHHLTNKKVYICFILGFATMLATSPLRAEDSATRKTPVHAKQPAAKAPSTPVNIPEIVEQAARTNQVDPLLVHSIIQVESNYNPYAVSPKGAQGLMQLMPGTAWQMGVGNSFDARQNIEAGVRYLKYLQDLYKDDRLALAAYNAGPAAVEKYKNVPPYAETQNYVKRVGQQYGEAKAKQKAAEPPPSVAPAAPVVVEEHPKLEQFVDQDGRLHLTTAKR
jgi:soluble lytic murein transglycosylase-like protein